MRKIISVIIPTFNSGKILNDCLETVKGADEIICVDMGSTDGTLDICKKYKAKIIHNTPKDGNFDINRKIGIQEASGDWILKLDSDDRLTKRLQGSIKRTIQKDEGLAGYRLYNKVFFFNQEIKHGYRENKSSELRLFKRNKWTYQPSKFHQQIKVCGETSFLEGEYLHFNSQSIFEFIKKTNTYTSLDSLYDYKIRKDVNFLHCIISPVRVIFKYYILRLSFLDGTIGLIVTILFSIYNFIYKIKIWEKRK